MFKEDFMTAANGAAGKAKLLKNNPAGYFLLAVLAGMFIGFGILGIPFSIFSFFGSGKPCLDPKKAISDIGRILFVIIFRLFLTERP